MDKTQNIKEIVASISNIVVKCINELNDSQNINKEVLSNKFSVDLIKKIEKQIDNKENFPSVILILSKEIITAVRISLKNNIYEIEPILFEVQITPDGAIDTMKYIKMEFNRKLNKKKWFITAFNSNQQLWSSDDYVIEDNFWAKLHSNNLSYSNINEYIFTIMQQLCTQSALDELKVKSFYLCIPDYFKDYCNTESLNYCIKRIEKLRGLSNVTHINKLIRNSQILEFSNVSQLYALMQEQSCYPKNHKELILLCDDKIIKHGYFEDGEIKTISDKKEIHFNETFAIGILKEKIPNKKIPKGYYFFNSKNDIIRNAIIFKLLHEETNLQFKLNNKLKSFKDTTELLNSRKNQIKDNNIIIKRLEAVLATL